MAIKLSVLLVIIVVVGCSGSKLNNLVVDSNNSNTTSTIPHTIIVDGTKPESDLGPNKTPKQRTGLFDVIPKDGSLGTGGGGKEDSDIYDSDLFMVMAIVAGIMFVLFLVFISFSCKKYFATE